MTRCSRLSKRRCCSSITTRSSSAFCSSVRRANGSKSLGNEARRTPLLDVEQLLEGGPLLVVEDREQPGLVLVEPPGDHALVVGEPIQERGLQPLLRRQLTHARLPHGFADRTRQVELDLLHLEQADIVAVGREHALAAAERDVADRVPFGAARQANRRVAVLGPGIAGRHESDRFAIVAPGEARRQPDEITQILRRLERDLADACERHPEIAALQDDLEHRAKAWIGIGDPGERLAVNPAGHGVRLLEGFGRAAPAPPHARPVAVSRAASLRAPNHGSGSPRLEGLLAPWNSSARNTSQAISGR